MDNEQVIGLPSVTSLKKSSLSLPYTPSALVGMGVDGEDTVLVDKKNGGLITSGPVALDQVFGGENTWTKVGFYLKMNSAQGVYDGVLMQWIDDKRTFINETLAWIQPGYQMVKWNSVLIGGNDGTFTPWPNDERRQAWYAIDDLKVYNGIPAGRGLI